MAEPYRFAAFISYSSKDAAFAKRLREALETYNIPTALGRFELAEGGKKNRLYPIFRDRDELPSGNLDELLKAGLAASNALVVICSPHAAASLWVEKEIEHFIGLGRRDRIFAIIAPNAPLEINGRDATPDCFPAVFRNDANGGEPIAGDARKKKDGFRAAWLKVVAGILGVNAGKLIDRDGKRRWQLAMMVSGVGITVATVIGLVAGWQITSNTRGEMTIRAEQLVREGRPVSATPFALAGLADEGSVLGGQRASAEAVVAQLGLRIPQRDLHYAKASGVGVTPRYFLSADGNMFVYGYNPDPDARSIVDDVSESWDLSGKASPISLGSIPAAFMSADGSVIATEHYSGLTMKTRDTRTGGELFDFGQVDAKGLSADGSRIAISRRTTDGTTTVSIHDTRTGALIENAPPLEQRVFTSAILGEVSQDVPEEISPPGAARVLATSPDGRLTVVGADVDNIPTEIPNLFYSAYSSRLMEGESELTELGPISRAQFTPDGKVLLTIFESRDVSIRDSYPVFRGSIWRHDDGWKEIKLPLLEGASEAWLSNHGDFIVYRNNFHPGFPGKLFVVETREGGVTIELKQPLADDEPDDLAMALAGNASRLAVTIANGQDLSLRLYDLSHAPKGTGAQLKAQICATSADYLMPFSASDRAANPALRGRPWNPCDWRGLGSGEGMQQSWRRFAVLFLGAEDYTCAQSTANGGPNPRREAMCARPNAGD